MVVCVCTVYCEYVFRVSGVGNLSYGNVHVIEKIQTQQDGHIDKQPGLEKKVWANGRKIT